MLTDEELLVLELSLRTSAAALLLILIPGIAAGWWLARTRRLGRRVIEALLCSPLVLPPVVVGYGLLLLFSPVKSPLGRWLMASGFEVVYTWRAVALACAVVSLPLLLRSVKTAVEAVDTRLERAARLLGAGPWRVFFSITLPLSLRGIIAGAILAFTRSVGEFGATVMFAGMIPNRTVTLSSAVFQKIMLLDDDRGALRLVIVSVLLSVAALMIAEWLNRRAVRGMPE